MGEQALFTGRLKAAPIASYRFPRPDHIKIDLSKVSNQARVVSNCFLFDEDKSFFCKGCPNDKEGDLESTIRNCIQSLSGFKDWGRIELERFLVKLIEIGKDEKVSDRNKAGLAHILESILKPSIQRPEIAGVVGNAFALLGNSRKALEWYEIALEREKDDRTALNNKGVVLAQIGRETEAILCYDRVIELHPDDEKAWFNKGRAYIRLKSPEKAATCYRKVVQINPRNVSAWNNLGVALRLVRGPREAIKCFNTALRINRNYKWAWNNMGIAYMLRKKYKSAAECFRKALEIDPDFEEAKEGLRVCSGKL